MAKKRKRSRKPSWITKGINIGVLLLALSRPLQHLFAGMKNRDWDKRRRWIADEATFGMAGGQFNLETGMQLYGPMIAAIALKKIISVVRRTARV